MQLHLGTGPQARVVGSTHPAVQFSSWCTAGILLVAEPALQQPPTRPDTAGSTRRYTKDKLKEQVN